MGDGSRRPHDGICRAHVLCRALGSIKAITMYGRRRLLCMVGWLCPLRRRPSEIHRSGRSTRTHARTRGQSRAFFLAYPGSSRWLQLQELQVLSPSLQPPTPPAASTAAST